MGDKTDFVEHAVNICEYDACIVRHALQKRLECVTEEIRHLRLAKECDLSTAERAGLPETLRNVTREELLEQIDPWISLQMTIEDLIKRFTLK